MRNFWFGVVGVAGAIAASGAGVMEPLLAVTWLYCAARITRGFLAWEREEWITDAGRFL